MKTNTEISLRRHLVAAKMASIALTAAALFIAGSPAAQAASETWTPTTAGTFFWTTTTDWNGAAAPGATGNPNSTTCTDTATFLATANAQTITIDSGRNVENLIFTAGAAPAGNYTFTGGPLILTGGGSIYNDIGALGTTTAANGGGGAAIFSTVVTLEGNYSFVDNNSGGYPFNTLPGSLQFSGAITNGSGSAATLTLGGSYFFSIGSVISGPIGNTGSTINLLKNGAGGWLLSGTSSYNGTTTIDAGVLNVAVLANAGAGSSIGDGLGSTTTADIIFDGGTLQYTGLSGATGGTKGGNPESTNRLIAIGDATGTAFSGAIDSSVSVNGIGFNKSGAGTGTLSFTNTNALVTTGAAGNAVTLTLTGVNISNNTFALQLVDGSSTGLSLNKSGAGTWILTNTASNTYSGATTITEGVLRDGTAGNLGLSANSLLDLAGGAFETQGSLNRTLGNSGGNIEFLPSSSTAYFGDFSPTGLSANGGALSVTLTPSGGAAGGTLVWGSSFFNPSALLLNAYTANNIITLNNGVDLAGATRLVDVEANSATITGSIINSGTMAAGLSKGGVGTLTLSGSNSYNGGTGVGGGVLIANAVGSLGTGNVTVWDGAELRLTGVGDVANGATVTLNNGILGETYNATQAGLAAILNSNSSGILALDAAQSNALNMAALGNGAMYLGSSTTGAYSASSLGITSGGTELDSGGAPNQIATFGGYYRLGGGGGTLTITGQNVLTNQPFSLLLNNITASAPGQSLLTSNNYNSLIVGDGATAFGTVDLQNSQNYSGTTTINAGSTLNLDYSGGLASISTAGNVNIISQYTPVILNGGTLEVTGGAGSVDTQSFNSVTSNLGSNTIDVNANGATGATLNLGALTTNNGATTLLENQTGSSAAVITTTTAPTNGTLGAAYVFDNNGAYGWAQETANTSGGFNLTNLTGETTLPASNASGTNDYLETGSVTTTAAESINLLRVTGGGTLKIGSAINENLTANGILDTGSANLTLEEGTGNSSLTSTSGGNLYIYNYGTGTLSITSNVGIITGTENVIFGGTGLIDVATSSVAGNIYNYTGVTYLDGATINFGENTNPFSGTVNASVGTAGSGYIVVNPSTTFEAINNTSGVAVVNPLILNGNFTLTNGTGNNSFSGNTTLTNNITVTVNSQAGSTWDLLGAIGDGGFGYGLTVGANSGPLLNDSGTRLNTPLILSGANTFTGPINVLADGLQLGASNTSPATETNRFNVLGLAANTIVYLDSEEGVYSMAGINDIGNSTNTATISPNDPNARDFVTIDLWGSGNYSFGGDIANGNNETLELTMNGAGGTQTLTGANTFTDGLTVNAGTLIVDASKGGSVASQPLALGGGTFELIGATTGTTQSFSSTAMNAGQSNIVANSTYGTTTLNLGTLSNISNVAAGIGGVLDIAPIGTNSTVTTTVANGASGVLGDGNVVYTSPTTGVTTWATDTGTTPFTIGAYTGDTTVLGASGGSTSTNYMLSGSQTLTASESINLLRISNTGANTLNLGAANLGLNGNGLLYNGTAAYTITGGNLYGLQTTGKELVIDNFAGTGGSLTIASNIDNNGANANALVLAGTGTTFLTGTNTYTGTTYFDGGTTNFNSSNNFSGSTAFVFGGGTLQYATGNTYDLSNKTLTPNASGATFDTNGNAVTWNHNFGNSGVGGITFVDSANAANPGSAAGSITIFGDAQNTGAVTVDNGGVVNLNGALNTAGYTYVGPIGTLEGGTTQATSGTQSTSSAYAGKLVLQSGGVVSPGSPGVGASPNSGGAGTGIQGGGVGSGGNLNANVGGIVNNVLSATQLQWYAGGTLSFYLDDTGYAGASASAPVASTQLNLALGSLAKMGGTGQYILNFNNTGGYYVNGGTVHSNVYDLINFGGPTVANNENPNGNTDFNVDDFTIENLDGIGVLSFYYNPLANGGNGTTIPGQEELLLTVIPEPSTWAMLIGGLATLIFWTRRKRAAANRSLARK